MFDPGYLLWRDADACKQKVPELYSSSDTFWKMVKGSRLELISIFIFRAQNAE